jgi:integrase
MKLTQRILENLTCPPGRKDMLVSDDDQKGHFIRVGEGARKGSLEHKSSNTQYDKDGKTRRIFNGPLSGISLAAGREATRAILGQVALGRDPASERKQAARETKRKAAQDALTFEALLQQWDALHLASRRERYRAEAVRALRYAFADHLKAPAAELSRTTVVRILDGLATDDKAAMAGATKRYGGALYSWAMKRGAVEANPFANLPTTPVARRERVLTDHELRAVWEATAKPGPFNGIVQALALTAQRREEIAKMAWSALAPDLSTWTVSSGLSKNHRPHVVPLSEEMRTLLRAQPRREGTDLVFPGERGVFCGWSKSKTRLDKLSGVSAWTLHDLRRSGATGMAELGVAPHIVEAVLNHASGHKAGVAGIYNHARYENEKRRALSLWGAHVAAIVEGGEAQGNVTPIKARGSAKAVN